MADDIFSKLDTGSRLMDEWHRQGTVEIVYRHPPLTGAIILWDDGDKSWPTADQINKMQIVNKN